MRVIRKLVENVVVGPWTMKNVLRAPLCEYYDEDDDSTWRIMYVLCRFAGEVMLLTVIIFGTESPITKHVFWGWAVIEVVVGFVFFGIWSMWMSVEDRVRGISRLIKRLG